MKLLRAGKSRQVFILSLREKQLLLETIKLYPLVPAAHHRLSRDRATPQSAENQHLLEEALADQRESNRRQVLAILNEPERFREVKSGFELALAPGEREWLLQVLNDVRVGCWLQLGEPEQGAEPVVEPRNVKYLIAMELAGMFESVLLHALGVTESSEWIE